jgi:hypothetical protein
VVVVAAGSVVTMDSIAVGKAFFDNVVMHPFVVGGVVVVVVSIVLIVNKAMKGEPIAKNT